MAPIFNTVVTPCRCISHMFHHRTNRCSACWDMVDEVSEGSDRSRTFSFLEHFHKHGCNHNWEPGRLTFEDRASIILSMIASSNLATLEFHIRSQQMDFMRRHTTGLFRIVCQIGFQVKKEHTDVAIATDPSCPQAIMQFQHGTVVMNTDLSLSLSPFSVDGRQLQSNPCSSNKKSTYQRYNQSETISVR